MATKWIESGTAATQDLSFYKSSGVGGSGTVTSNSQAVKGSVRSLKLSTTNLTDYAYAQSPDGVLGDAGRRVTCYVRFDKLPTAATDIILFTQSSTAANFSVGWDNNGKLRLFNSLYTSVATGTTTLAINTDYRISVAYTITNGTTNSISVYLNGVLELSVSNINSSTASSNIIFGIGPISAGNYATSSNVYIAHIYIDDGTTGDVGGVQVTAKRPNANGTTNGFTTQIGAGGSGYGSGHSPQVNERPLSTTNGWSHVVAGSAITEEYNIESRSTGDVDITSNTLVDYAGWVYAKALTSETAQLVLNNANNAISLTTTNTLFAAYAGSTTYPAGTGTDIGLITATTATTVSLFEAGILMAYSPSAPTVTSGSATWKTSTSTTGGGNVTSDGGGAITERGIVVATTVNPTTSDTKFTTSGTTGAFTVDATSLTAGTVYHLRAYATNATGTSYSADVPFYQHQQWPRLLLETGDLLLQEDNSSKILLENPIFLDNPLDAATVTDTTPDLTFIGTDPSANQLQYEVQIDTASTFDSQSVLMDSYSETNANVSISIDGGAGEFDGYGQSFTGDGGVLGYIKLYLKKTGSPTGNANAVIYAHSGTFGAGGVPTGTALATSNNFDVSTLTTSSVLTQINFSGANLITLANGTKYFLCFEFTGGNSTNAPQLGIDSTGPTHGGNAAPRTVGSGYTSNNSVDVPFYVYSTPPLLDKTSSVDVGFKDVSTDSRGDDFLLLETGDKLLQEDGSSRLVLNYNYPSGDYVSYTVQSALSDNTYYWRARQRVGLTGTWSSWSEIRDFSLVSSTTTTKTILGKARITVATAKTLLGKARITATATKTILGKARIAFVTTKTLLGKARITKSTAQTLAGKARVTASATKTLLGKARITVTTTKTLLGKANITIVYTKTLLGKARITVSTTKTLTGKARITAAALKTLLGKARVTKSTAQTLLGKSRITASATKTLLGKAAVLKTTTRTILGKARITVTTTKTLAGRARITVSTAKTLSGKARVTVSTAKTILGKARVTATTTRTILGRARVQVTTTKTILGRARIAYITPKTLQGLARITKSTSKTLTGKARITASTTKTLLGKARVTATTVKTILGKARIQVTTTKTLLGRARITIVTSKTLTGKARITASAVKTILGKSRITVTTTKTILGKAYILVTGTSSQTLLGKARVTASATKTILGKAAVKITTVKTLLGQARITVSAIKTLNGKARVTAATAKSILGRADILKATQKTLAGIARVTASATKTLSGKARITKSVAKTLSGKARITILTAKTLLGKARVTKSAAQTLLGKARITKVTTKTLLGKAYINLSSDTVKTILGKARVTQTATKTILGKARIGYITPKTLLGKARVTKTVTKTLLGRAKITASATKNILGKAAILRTTTKTLLGKARIGYITSKTLSGKARITSPTNQTITGKAQVGATTTQNIQGVARIKAKPVIIRRTTLIIRKNATSLVVKRPKASALKFRTVPIRLVIKKTSTRLVVKKQLMIIIIKKHKPLDLKARL